jgi:hypothetical protein
MRCFALPGKRGRRHSITCRRGEIKGGIVSQCRRGLQIEDQLNFVGC